VGTNVLTPFLSRFVVVSVLNKKSTTSVSKRTTYPVYAPEDATFDFSDIPFRISLADHIGVVELVVWLRNEYLDGVSIPLEDWFCDNDKDGKDKEKMYGFDQPGNEACILLFMLFDMNTYLIH